MGASYPESTNPQFGAGLSADAGSWGYPTHFNKEISDVSKSLFMWGPPNIFNWRQDKTLPEIIYLYPSRN